MEKNPKSTGPDNLGYLQNVSILQVETFVFTQLYIYTSTGRCDRSTEADYLLFMMSLKMGEEFNDFHKLNAVLIH